MTEQTVHRGGERRDRQAAAQQPAPQPANALAAAGGIAEARTEAPAPDALSADAPRVTAATRRPFGSTAQRLEYAQRAGYHRHWFNEVPGRLERALTAGYNFVEDVQGKRVNRVVGVAHEGGPLKAFLMEIPQEWYDQDMGAEQKKVAETNEAIRSGRAMKKDPKDSDGAFYTPAQGTSLRHGERSR